jgi:hypothetical protein
MKAEESKPKGEQSNVQTNENTVVTTEQTVPAQAETNPTPNQAGAENPTQAESSTSIQTIDIDGQQVSIEELKGGYLRQSDYTRKTQELARTKKELERAEQVYKAMNVDEATAQEISEKLGIEYVSPQQSELVDIQTKYETLILERDIEKLQAKHGDFDVTSVLQVAYDKNISLDDAYVIANAGQTTTKTNGSLDIEAIKEQIRQELKQELQSSVDTSTIISTSGNTRQITDNSPQLTAQEIKVATAMKIPLSEYAKYKNRK